MLSEYGKATLVVFPYLEVKETKRTGKQLHQRPKELA
jgi:hypothetical protein